jgi:hypothetical protein
MLRFPAVTPAVRAELPVGVATWLLPAALAYEHARR